MTDQRLDVKALHVTMGRRQVLAGLDLELPEGQTLGIAGESGSGKSTACRVVTGTLGRHGGVVTSGKATLGDLDLRSLDESGWRKLRGRTIALVPQTSLSGLDPVMRIGRQLSEAIRLQAPDADAEEASARATRNGPDASARRGCPPLPARALWRNASACDDSAGHLR